MAQSAIEWLEAAGVNCTSLRAKLAEIQKSHAAKNVGGRSHKAAPVPANLLYNVVHPFVSSALVIDALAEEIVEEFSAKPSKGD